MRLATWIVGALSVVVAGACDSGRETPIPSARYPDSARISTSGKELVSGAAFGYATRVEMLSRGHFAVVDGFAPHVHIVDASTGRVLRSTGNPGDGPGDVQHVRAAVGDMSEMWAYDISRTALVELARERAPRNSLRRVQVRGPGMLMALTRVDPNSFVALAAGAYGSTVVKDATVARVDIAANRISWYGADRPAVDRASDSLPTVSRRYLREFTFGCADTTTRRFLRGNRLSSVLEVVAFDDGRSLGVWRGPVAVSPPIQRTPRGNFIVTTDPALRVGYAACAADAGGVWVTFENRLMDKVAEPQDSTELHRYTWDGTLSHVVYLKPAIAEFTVDRARNALVGITQDGLAIWRYSLPKDS